LLLQIRSKDQECKEIAIATKIIRHHFDEFTKKHFDKIGIKLGVSEEELKMAIDEILKLNPKPGGAYSDPLNKSTLVIMPDFILENDEGELVVSINSRNSPELRISRTYSEIMESYSSNNKKPSNDQKEAITFVKQKIDSARWFIDAIRQRQNTLLLCMNAILEYQKEYFEEGDETKLKPMILKDIAYPGSQIANIFRPILALYP
jgi:RNA polymerase sigma-54 factor